MRIFSKYTWRFSSDKKEIFLTFDDGPTPEITQFVLDELQKYKAKATFFCIGKNVIKQPSIFNRILDDGHGIGNHTQNHLKGWKHTKQEYFADFLECENNLQDFKNTYKVSKTLQETATIKQKIFRPPYGKIKRSQAKDILKKGYKIIMWTVLSADFDNSISKEKCLDNVLKNTKNGSIIVFHDSIKAAEKLQFVLPKVLEHFTKKGVVFKAI